MLTAAHVLLTHKEQIEIKGLFIQGVALLFWLLRYFSKKNLFQFTFLKHDEQKERKKELVARKNTSRPGPPPQISNGSSLIKKLNETFLVIFNSKLYIFKEIIISIETFSLYAYCLNFIHSSLNRTNLPCKNNHEQVQVK